MVRQSVAPSRRHALDSLRGAMTFPGIDLHAAAACSPKSGGRIE
jgi:hypothetical protein